MDTLIHIQIGGEEQTGKTACHQSHCLLERHPRQDDQHRPGYSGRVRLTALFLCACMAHGPALGQEKRRPPLVPETPVLEDAARQAIEADWLTDDERAELRIFHGVWDGRDLTPPQRRAEVALNAWRLDDPALRDPSVAPELQAEAKLIAGELRDALRLLSDVDSFRAARIRAQA